MQPYEIALLILSIVLVLFLLFAFLYLCVLPRVIVHKIRTAPNPDGEMTYPDNFDELKAKVKIERDLVYPSKKPSNRYNLYIWGRAYFRKLLWIRSRPAKQTVICSHLTDAFPPTFLTDGNKGSFEVQNRMLAKALKERGISVEELYFDPEQGDVPHEYLFHLHEANSQLCMSRIGTFLGEYLN